MATPTSRQKTCPQMVERILALSKRGDSCTTIAQNLGMNRSTVYNILKRGVLSAEKPRSRPSKLTPEIEQVIIDALKEKPRLQVSEMVKLVEEHGISAYMIRNMLKRKKIKIKAKNPPPRRAPPRVWVWMRKPERMRIPKHEL